MEKQLINNLSNSNCSPLAAWLRVYYTGRQCFYTLFQSYFNWILTYINVCLLKVI